MDRARLAVESLAAEQENLLTSCQVWKWKVSFDKTLIICVTGPAGSPTPPLLLPPQACSETHQVSAPAEGPRCQHP